MDTTIRIKKETREDLDELKIHQRQSYEEIIRGLLDVLFEHQELLKEVCGDKDCILCYPELHKCNKKKEETK